MNNNFKLEKGMYQEPGRSFSQVLESIDPSDKYIGTPLEGLDAFQRQLKRFDIKVRGAGSDPVEKFFATTDSAVLFPEYVARAVRHGIEESDILPMITASTTIVSTVEQANTGHVKISKRGRMMVSSYDAIRAQKLDLFSVTLRQIGAYIARSRLQDAIGVLIDGNDSNPAEVVPMNGAPFNYDAMLNFWMRFDPYEMNVVLASNDVVLELLRTQEFQPQILGFNIQHPNAMTTPFGATLIRTSAAPEQTVIGLDKRFALEMIHVGSVTVEYEKLINKQFERAAITTIAGFSKICDGASKVLSNAGNNVEYDLPF